jgi:hypothetical protein
MRLTSKQYEELLARRAARNKGTSPKLEPPVLHEPLEAGEAEKGDTGRHRVIIETRRVRPTDHDNLCEKFHIDALRHLGLIPDDDPKSIDLVTIQKKVRHKVDEKTVITVQKI